VAVDPLDGDDVTVYHAEDPVPADAERRFVRWPPKGRVRCPVWRTYPAKPGSPKKPGQHGTRHHARPPSKLSDPVLTTENINTAA
jgi:hypothetical protein